MEIHRLRVFDVNKHDIEVLFPCNKIAAVAFVSKCETGLRSVTDRFYATCSCYRNARGMQDAQT